MKLDFEGKMAEIEKTANPKVLCLSSMMESK